MEELTIKDLEIYLEWIAGQLVDKEVEIDDYKNQSNPLKKRILGLEMQKDTLNDLYLRIQSWLNRAYKKSN